MPSQRSRIRSPSWRIFSSADPIPSTITCTSAGSASCRALSIRSSCSSFIFGSSSAAPNMPNLLASAVRSTLSSLVPSKSPSRYCKSSRTFCNFSLKGSALISNSFWFMSSICCLSVVAAVPAPLSDSPSFLAGSCEPDRPSGRPLTAVAVRFMLRII